MAVKYTYEDFEKAASNAGLLGQFSKADLSTAQSDPNFGMSILSLKQNYANAATDDERQKINEQANNLRSSYGNYTGGSDGSQYISTGKLNNDIDDAISKVNGYGSFQYDTPAPTYSNQFSAQQQALLNELLNREAFEWSKETDPLWSSYKKEYLREGDRATANALGTAAAASGGIPSSYAVTAGTQAGDYYATQLSDKIPALRAQAYDEYLDEYERQLSNLNAVNNQEQLEYQKYLNELNQYNTDRSFAYNDYQTQYNMLQNALSNLQNQQQLEYTQNFQTQQYMDALEQYQNEQKQQELENALQMAQIFGYVPENGANALGLAAGTKTADQAYNDWYMAQQAAKAVSGTGVKVADDDAGGNDVNVYQWLYDNGATNEGQAYSMLLAAGKSSTEAAKLAGYYVDEYARMQAAAQETGDPVGDGNTSLLPGSPGYNSAYFTAAMNSLASQLAQGNGAYAVMSIDSFWDKLSDSQKAQVQTLLAKYGYSYS